MPIEAHAGEPSGIELFDLFDDASISTDLWDSAVILGSTQIIESVYLAIQNAGTGTAGISHLPLAYKAGKNYRITVDIEQASESSGGHAEASLVLYKDAENYIKFGLYKDTSEGIDKQAYIRYKKDNVASTIEIASTATGNNICHYTLVVTPTHIIVYFNGTLKKAIAFPDMIEYEIRLEAGTESNADILYAYFRDFELHHGYDPLLLAIGNSARLAATRAKTIIDEGVGGFDIITAAIDDSITLSNTTEQFIEFTTATYGTIFMLNLIFDLESSGIDHCFIYDAATTVYTDQTIAANDLQSGNIYLAGPTGPTQWDGFRIGNDTRFHVIDVYLEGGVPNVSHTIAWYAYYNDTWNVITPVSDGTVFNGKVLGKSGRVVFTEDLQYTTDNGVPGYWVLAVITSAPPAGSEIPMASHIQVVSDGATGFDSLAQFLSYIEVKIYRKRGSTYMKTPTERMLFPQCILDRSINIMDLICWQDVKVGLRLSSTPVDDITIYYGGYAQTLVE